MKALRYIYMIGLVLSGMMMTSCDVHEFPKAEQDVNFVLHLRYDTNMPLHKIVYYYNDTRAGHLADFGLRYIVKAYPVDENGVVQDSPACEIVLAKEDENNLDHSVELLLKKGEYEFKVWTDYVEEGCTDPLFYDAESFQAISFAGDEYVGNNDFRDAYVGQTRVFVSHDTSEAVIDMKRPLAKFNVISTDVSEFFSKVMAVRAKKMSSSLGDNIPYKPVHPDDFTVIIRYYGFIPKEFNIFADRPSDSCTGLYFKSGLRMLNESEVEIGFDYVFVNGSESSIYMSIEVYDYDGELLSRTNNIEVPLLRGKLTTVKDNFLTSMSDDGVTIVPEFDGEYNIQIK